MQNNLIFSLKEKKKHWNLGNFRIYKAHEDIITDISWAPGGKSFVTTSADCVKWWTINGKLIKKIKNSSWRVVTNIEWAPNAGYLIGVSESCCPLIWRKYTSDTFNPIIMGRNELIYSLAWSPDCECLSAALQDGSIIIFDIGGKMIGRLNRHSPMTCCNLQWSKNNKLLAATTTDHEILIIDEKGNIIDKCCNHDDRIDDIGWLHDNKTLGIVYHDLMIAIWNIYTNEFKFFQINESNDKYRSNRIYWNPTGEKLAISSMNPKIWILDSAAGIIKTLKTHKNIISHLAWSPDGRYLASPSYDMTIGIHNNQGKLERILIGHKSAVTNASWSPDGKYIATSSLDGMLCLWNIRI
jgi:WD40 repeat protein